MFMCLLKTIAYTHELKQVVARPHADLPDDETTRALREVKRSEICLKYKGKY